MIYHDPARAPFRVIGEAAFETSWQKSDRWTMLALPPASGARPRPGDADGKSTVVDAGDAACTGLITSGIELVGDGDRAAALEAFALAADLCPASSAPLREAAGVHALERRWPEARRLAQAAVDRDRHDDHAWRILATSAYVLGDVRGALRAWNVVGEPRVDLVTVQGLTRTRHASATALLDVPTDITLSTTRLDAARRRLAELPSADLARVQYQPAAGGRANVEGVVVERPLLPSSPASLALIGVRAAIDRELGVDLSSPAGAGDRLSASWRWWENRPRVALSYAAPSRRGVWRVDVRAERQTYGAAVREVERRRGGSVTLANWSNRLLRWEVGGHLDAWGGTARTGALSAALDQRLASDRVSVRGEVQALGGSFAAVAQSVEVGIRSATRHEGLTWIAGGAVDLVSSRAPLALWSGAGTGQGRRHLLRAHPLLDDGRLTGDVFGRRVYAATVEGRAWLPPIFRLLRIAPAAFVDIARAEERRVPGSAWQADAGAGLRVALPGSGMLRIDVGKGLRDGATALSVGWTR